MKVANTLIPLSLTTQLTSAAPINHLSPVNVNTTQVDTHKALDMRSSEGLHSISWIGTDKYKHEYECQTDDQCGPFGFCAPKKPTKQAAEPVNICHCEDGYVNEPEPGNVTTPDEVCSYKQLSQSTQLKISGTLGWTGADYFASARGEGKHIATGVAKLLMTPMVTLLGTAIGKKQGAKTGAFIGGGIQFGWYLGNLIQTSFPPEADTSFRDGKGVSLH